MLLPLNPLPLYPDRPLLLPEYDTGRNNEEEDVYLDAGVLEVGMYRTEPALDLAPLAVAVAVFFFLRPKTFNNFFFRPMYE
jgi:hypothetical protein